MNKLQVKNVQEVKGEISTSNGNQFTVKPIVAGEDATKCRVNVVEVPPGNYAYGYHYHEMEEEVFYIISGTGIVRTEKGDIAVKTGDMITFPTGKEGSHVIRNASAKDVLTYIDFGTCSIPEIAHFPDTGKVMVIGPYSHGMYTKD